MSVKNIFTLFLHDVRLCFKSLLVFQLFLAPVSLWLIIFLIFGRVAIGSPKIGLLENENSELVQPFLKNADVSVFSDDDEIVRAMKTGKLDMGIILSQGFDTAVRSGEEGKLKIFINGASPLQRRVQAFVILQKGVLLLQNKAPVVKITPESLGNADILPFYNRLLPIVVLIAVMMGGIFIPATSLIDDKQRETFQALLVTPVSIYEVIWAKMFLGGLISFLMGLMIMALNQSLSANTASILGILVFVAMSASCFGCIIGFISKDMKSVTTLAQSLMLLMYAPAILNLFPEIPTWIQKLFPTYYFFSPLLKLSDGSFNARNSWEIVVLVGVFVSLQMILLMIIHKSRTVNNFLSPVLSKCSE